MTGVLPALRAARGRAVRATVSMIGPLVIAAALGRLDLGVIATSGAFAGFAVWEDPYRRRARVVAGMGCALVLAMVLGTLTASSGITAALVGGIVVAVAAFVAMAFELPPPREYFVALTFLLGTGLPPADAGTRAACVAGGAAFAWAVATSGALVWPRRPQDAAVARAFDAIARLLEAVGTDDAPARQHEAVLAVRAAHAAVRHAGGLDRPTSLLRDRAVAAEALLEAAMAHVIDDAPRPPAAWPAAIREVGAGRIPAVPEAAGVAPGSPGGRLQDALRGAIRAQEGTGPSAPLVAGTETTFALRRALAPQSIVPVAAARIGIALAAGLGLGRLLGLQHGYWVGLSAAAVLQATNATLARHRAAHRAVGTALGVLVAAGILALHLGVAATVAAIAVLQILTELLIGVNYAVAVVFLTSLPLLLIHAAGVPQSSGSLVAARLLDTVIGCAVGVVAGMLLWRRATRHRLPAAQAAALEAARRLIAVSYGSPAPAPELLHRARRELRGALVNLRAVHRDALGDARPRDADADRRWPTTVAVQRLAYLALSPLRDVAIAPDRLARLDAAVATLAADVRSGAPSPGARLPSLDELPHTSAQLAELRRELEGLQAG